MKIQLKALALAISATLLLTACHDDDDKHYTVTQDNNTHTDQDKDKDKEEPNKDAKALTAVLQDQQLTLFSQGLQVVAGTDKQDLLQEIEAMPSVTVLAPTDEAINKTVAILDKLGLLTDLDKSGKVDAYDLVANKELLGSLLKYHVLTEKLGSADVVNKLDTNLKTLNGAPLFVTKSGNDYIVPSQAIQLANMAKADSETQAKVDMSKLDLEIKNGYVHVIDQALIPPTMTADEVLAKIPQVSEFDAISKAGIEADANKKSLSDFAETKSDNGYTYLIPNNTATNAKCKALQEQYSTFLTKPLYKDGSCNKEAYSLPLVLGSLPKLIQPVIQADAKFSGQLTDIQDIIVAPNIIAKDGVIQITNKF
ncbi:fasciclin domain-containing protein [Psychrobacter sp. I-STPA10]|uniref:fasciclin domain-containing protein n=1 Tax=Psychrobacter sp. I-STPA10 TaxID=2585769 RepID=UPI001E45A241|nr:fasciclin domain-containing protein [Psychrobacter sp. I-STPA10]